MTVRRPWREPVHFVPQRSTLARAVATYRCVFLDTLDSKCARSGRRARNLRGACVLHFARQDRVVPIRSRENLPNEVR